MQGVLINADIPTDVWAVRMVGGGTLRAALAAAHSSLVHESMTAGVVIAAHDDVVGSGIAGAAIDFGNQFSLAESNVLQIDDLSARENRLARGPPLGDGQNDIVGQPRKVQRLRLAGPAFELSQACQRKYRILLEARAQQSSNRVTRCERLLLRASDAHELDAGGIVEARSAGNDKLLHFRVGDFELAELLDTLEVHVTPIERGRVGVPRVAAAGGCGQEQYGRDRNADTPASKVATGFRHGAEHTSILVMATANGETPCLGDILLVSGLTVDPKAGSEWGQSKIQIENRKQPVKGFLMETGGDLELIAVAARSDREPVVKVFMLTNTGGAATRNASFFGSGHGWEIPHFVRNDRLRTKARDRSGAGLPVRDLRG
jgi:hypothetical protein